MQWHRNHSSCSERLWPLNLGCKLTFITSLSNLAPCWKFKQSLYCNSLICSYMHKFLLKVQWWWNGLSLITSLGMSQRLGLSIIYYAPSILNYAMLQCLQNNCLMLSPLCHYAQISYAHSIMQSQLLSSHFPVII